MELTLRRQKTLFLSFFVSGTQTTSKNYGKYRHHYFGRRKTSERRKRANGGRKAKRGWPTRPLYLAAWGPPTWPSGLRSRRSFLHRLRLDLKTPIKKVPWRFAKGAPPKHRNTETEIRSCRLEGENSGGALPGWSPPSPMTSPPSPWWRGSSPPPGFGFVVVTWSNLSMYDHCWIPYDVPCMIMELSL